MTADGQLELALMIVVRAWVPMKRAGKLLGRGKSEKRSIVIDNAPAAKFEISIALTGR
jgi:hypothetical protein